MTKSRVEAASARSRRPTSDKAARRYRRLSNVALTRDVLIALALLAALGVLIGATSASGDLLALR
ncbi:MAG: hypothetical protein EPO67_07870 [Reyranella sp.]|jgi:hypothetical protein|nr:MAG: hypothetical protein EPO67_07870 [Reyranella sp.]